MRRQYCPCAVHGKSNKFMIIPGRQKLLFMDRIYVCASEAAAAAESTNGQNARADDARNNDATLSI